MANVYYQLLVNYCFLLLLFVIRAEQFWHFLQRSLRLGGAGLRPGGATWGPSPSCGLGLGCGGRVCRRRTPAGRPAGRPCGHTPSPCRTAPPLAIPTLGGRRCRRAMASRGVGDGLLQWRSYHRSYHHHCKIYKYIYIHKGIYKGWLPRRGPLSPRPRGAT